MRRLSLSKSALLLSPCIRWTWDGAKAYEDEYADTTKRDKGTNFHKGMEVYYAQGEAHAVFIPKTPDVANWLCLAIAWSKQHLEPRCAVISPEVYVGYNFSTGEVHYDRKVHDRNYPDMPGFTPGTADLVCLLADGTLLVADWKTGGGTGADKQLLSLAVGISSAYRKLGDKFSRVRLAVLYVSDAGVRPVEWEVTQEELDNHAFAMKLRLMDVAEGHNNKPAPGIHCTQLYCDHLAYCPAHTTTIDAAAEVSKPSLVSKKWDISEAPTSAEHAGSIMERVTAAKRQMKFYEERIKRWCMDGNKCVAGEFEYSKGADGFRWRGRK